MRKKSDFLKNSITNPEKQNGTKKQWDVSEQELRKLAAVAISDSLQMYGWGLKSKQFENKDFSTGRLASKLLSLIGFSSNINLIENQPTAHKIISQFLSNATNFQTINIWSETEWASFYINFFSRAAQASQAHNSVHQLNIEPGKINELALSANKILLASPEKTLIFLGAKFFIDSVLKNSNINSTNWRSGLSEKDILDIYINHVLGTESIKLDFECFHAIFLIFQENSYVGKSEKKKLQSYQQRNSLVTNTINQRISMRFDGIKVAIDYCRLLRKIEHESIIDPKIDSFCTVFGQNNYDLQVGTLTFNVCQRGSLKLAPPFDISVRNKSNLISNLKICNEGEISTTPAEDFEEQDTDAEKFMREEHGLSPLGGMRGLLLWSGGQHSFDCAKSELCKILPSAIRTAWLVISGGESALGYLIDPLYRCEDNGYRDPSVNGPSGNFSDMEDIRTFPEVFPIFKWIQQSIDHAFNVGENQGQSPDFLSNALLLLREADDMMSISPRQTFACSMAAVEVCLGGKGGELSQRIVQRMSRLLINQSNLRTTAEKLFLLLYELRSKIVHGDMCEISLEAAVFMRYVASCVVFNAGGFSKTLARMGNAGSVKDIRSELDIDKYGEQLLPGVLECKYLLHLIRAGLEKPDEWKQFSAGF